MSGTMMVQSWIKRKVMAIVLFKDLQGVQLIGRFDKSLLRAAIDSIDDDQVLLSVSRNYDGRNVQALLLFGPGEDRTTVALASTDPSSGVQRKLQE